LQRPPRAFGKPSSRWTLDLAAAVSVAAGMVPTRVSGETIRQTVLRLGSKLDARHARDQQPRSGIRPQKGRRDRLIAVPDRCA
jgi:hypothetical protein